MKGAQVLQNCTKAQIKWEIRQFVDYSKNIIETLKLNTANFETLVYIILAFIFIPQSELTEPASELQAKVKRYVLLTYHCHVPLLTHIFVLWAFLFQGRSHVVIIDEHLRHESLLEVSLLSPQSTVCLYVSLYLWLIILDIYLRLNQPFLSVRGRSSFGNARAAALWLSLPLPPHTP